MPTLDDALALPALAQARAIRAGEVSSRELTAACLERIARRNPQLSAFVSVFTRKARKAAREADERAVRRGEKPAFLGVPTGIKDLDIVAGTRTRFGSRAYNWFWFPKDGPVTQAVRAGGFVLLGKLATSEFGAMPVTEPDIHPPTRNPWCPERSAGGSSGGSGAAVAAGLVPIAQGSDGAGSIRIPSSFCHLFGYKPSRALIDNPYRRKQALGLTSIGPLAHTVEDGAAFADVLLGRTELGGAGSLLARCREAPGKLRIALCTESAIGPVHPEVVAAVEEVAACLRGLGHQVEPQPILRAELEDFLPIWQRMLATVPVLYEGWLQPITRWLRAEGRKYGYREALALRDRLARRVLDWFGDYDLWLFPSVAVPPPKIGAWRHLPPAEGFRAAAALGAFTAAFNVSGQPAASLPAGVSAEGWPIGAQLVGRPSGDGTLLALCRQLEEARPWVGRRAPGAHPRKVG